MSDIHRAFQWLLDPDGDPATVDAPDIVNASWTLTGRGPGACIAEFSDDIRALRSSGIAVVFAAGNDGPAARTSNSPANNPGVLSVGAMDARPDARAPVEPRPVELRRRRCSPDWWRRGSTFEPPTSRTAECRLYATVSGSSVAAPHVAGVLALLAGAYPAASVDDLEAALVRSAQDVGEAGPDNGYGIRCRAGPGGIQRVARGSRSRVARRAGLRRDGCTPTLGLLRPRFTRTEWFRKPEPCPGCLNADKSFV